MIVKRDVLFTPSNQTRRLHIWLPEDYEQSEKRYPVLYFFDGHNLFLNSDATYGKSWGLAEFLTHWDQELIIVGLECGHGPGERLSEYAPHDIHSDYLGDISAMGDQTLRWMVEELKPRIDQEYRTRSDRRATGIAGSSMGGLMSLYGAVRYNDSFSKAACVSSSVYWSIPELYADIDQSAIMPDTRIYLSWGTEEAGGTRATPEEDWETNSAQALRGFQHKLEQRGVSVCLFCQRYGGHCEADWEKQVPVFMDYLWKMQPSSCPG